MSLTKCETKESDIRGKYTLRQKKNDAPKRSYPNGMKIG